MIRLSIRRPVAVAMVYLSVALLGVAAWTNLPLELLPDASFPRLSVNVEWPGTSPETMEAFATSPIEAAIRQIRGVERITSTTREGSASIQVEFGRDVDMDFVRMELSERMAALEEELPDGVRTPTITPYVPREFQREASQPFLQYIFSGPILLEGLRLHLDEVVVPELLRVDGVSEIVVEGGRDRLLEIELDPDGIDALGLQPQDVAAALAQLDLVREAGAVRQAGDREWAVTIRNRPQAMDEVRDALLPGSWGTPVRVDDVAHLRDTFEDPRFHFRINGSPAVGFQVVNQRGVNAVRLAERVKERVEELQALSPPGTDMALHHDQSEEIRTQLSDLRNRALIAAVVIFLVLLAFLRSFRSAGIVFATIAFSILIALNLVYFGGLSLNLLTLMGLALGFGLIVDNSIVVLENIYRKWQQGAPPVAAAEEGAREVVLPILASTATTCIVFVPFVYLQGELRIFYLPLAVVVGLTLLASIFVAFTFIPALAARLLGTRQRNGAETPASTGEGKGGAAPAGGGATAAPVHTAAAVRERADSLLPAYARESPPLYIRFYSGLVELTLRWPWATVAVAVLCFAGSFHLFDNYVNRQALWGGGAFGQRSYISIMIDLPRGSDLERVDELTRYFEERIGRMPEVDRFEAMVQGTQSMVNVYFPEELEFTAVPLVIEEQIRAFSLGFSGARVLVRGMGPAFGMGGGGAAPNYRITLLGYNYERLAEIAEDLGRRLERHSRIHEVDTNATGGFTRDRATEFVATIDRDAVDRHEVSVGEVARLLNASVRGGERAGLLMVGGEELRFEVKLRGFREVDVDGLMDRIVTTSRGTRIPLGDLIRVEERRVLTAIRREDQQYERTVAYEFRGPQRLGDLVRDQALEATVLPAGYAIQERTPWRITREDEQQMALVLLVAIGLVFMVTAALFESIRQPLVVLLAVPMALIGVFLIFFYTGASFTREARIGVIMMGGIVVNNAILLVDHVNRVRAGSGLSFHDAVIRGTLERIRPILMTTATTVLGLLPLVLFTAAADATIWNALTYALIGGLLSSTLFVLTTTPALYLLFERGRAAQAEGAQSVEARPPPVGEPGRLGQAGLAFREPSTEAR
jgi:hydrophobic/amphiphilic exporter-1 (mainly G- bacteria), HAE1 family